MLCLFGADGSGKSTLARLLASYFTSRGMSTHIFWLRGSHLLASLLLRFLSWLGVFRGSCNPYYNVCIPYKLRDLWSLVEFWFSMPYIILYLFFSRLYRLVILDRCVIDFIVWVIVTLNYPSFINNVYGRFLLKLAERNLNIYLHADLKTLLKRTSDPKYFLNKELRTYNVLARYVSHIMIDTTECKPARCLARIILVLKQWSTMIQ